MVRLLSLVIIVLLVPNLFAIATDDRPPHAAARPPSYLPAPEPAAPPTIDVDRTASDTTREKHDVGARD